MKKFMIAHVVLAAGVAGVALAGNIDSPGDPSAGSGMPTINQVYDYLSVGTPATIAGSFEDPTAGPAPAMHTVNDVYAVVATPFPQCNALPSDVRSGVKFFCTQPGYWGVQTGTASGDPTPTPTITPTSTPPPTPTLGGPLVQIGSIYVATGLSNAGTADDSTMSKEVCIGWAANLDYLGYSVGSWRLPTRTELDDICDNKDMLDGYASDYYFTSELCGPECGSSEGDRYARNFDDCVEDYFGGVACRVRAVRDDD